MFVICRSLTGAWIETTLQPQAYSPEDVAPLRGRGLKREAAYGCQGENIVAPLRGRGLKHYEGRS